MSYALDFTGANPANHGTDSFVVNGKYSGFPYLFFPNGPAFGKGMTVSYIPDNEDLSRTLEPNFEWDYAFKLPGVGVDDDTRAWGGIILKNTDLKGQIFITSQSLGGNWNILGKNIADYILQNSFNPSRQEPVLVPAAPLIIPSISPTKTYSIFNEFTITQAQANLPVINLSIEYRALEAPTSTTGAGTLRKANVVNLTAGTSGSTAAGATNIEIINTGPVAITFDDAQVPAGQRIELNTKGDDVIDTIPWSIPAGGSAILKQMV